VVFQQWRSGTLHLARNPPVDLRLYRAMHAVGAPWDGHQWLLPATPCATPRSSARSARSLPGEPAKAPFAGVAAIVAAFAFQEWKGLRLQKHF
jgi:hypothetical protein